ncbi:hypothetical protein [Ralstonia solanacearum]|nr:hypothetical protein [Ralstonia solanacearum]
MSEPLDAKAWLAGMQTTLDTSARRPSPSSAPLGRQPLTEAITA